MHNLSAFLNKDETVGIWLSFNVGNPHFISGEHFEVDQPFLNVADRRTSEMSYKAFDLKVVAERSGTCIHLHRRTQPLGW
jgi:hypothetical protein